MNMHDIILHQIINNKLNGTNYDFVIGQLCVLNNKPYLEVKTLIDELIEINELGLNSANEIVVEELNEFVSHGGFNKFNKNNHKKNIKSVKADGKIQGTKGSYGFFIPFDTDQEDVFVSSENLNGAFNGDVVTVEITKGKRGKEGRVVRILERGNDKVVGKIILNKNHAFVVSDDVKFGKDIFVPLAKTLNAKQGDKVVVKINKFHTDNKNPEGAVVEVLGQPNTIETEVLSIIRSYNLYETFPKKVNDVACKLPESINKENYKHRLDLTKEQIFTIDGEDARDLDDAISLTENDNGTLTLGVHIADVGEYVKLHSVIDNEAFKRGTSVYFPNLVLPMLPKTLSNGICSLTEMQERLTLSVFITYDHSAKVVDYKFYESIIKSKKRFTYTEVDKILNNEPETLEKYGSFASTLHKMNMLAKKLSSLRDKRGAIDFDIPEVKISLNDLGDVLKVEKRERNDSHRLIESFMIAANEAVAWHFHKNKLPFVYRIHEKPETEKISKFLNFVKTFGITDTFNPENIQPKDIQKIISQITDNDIKYVVNRVCLRSLRKAKYFPECLGHFGLASTYYCHFTSPIRRYPDLTIHRIIKHYLKNQLNGNILTESKHFVNSSSQVSSEREVLAERAERDVDDLYKTFYMQHHLAEEFEGKISSVTAFGIYVELENTVEGLVRLEDLPADKYAFSEEEFMLRGMANSFKIGDRVKVKAVRADILAREVDFILV